MVGIHMNFNQGKSNKFNVKKKYLFNICSTTVAVAGDDYVVVASDTRLTENYSILSRTHSNVYKMYEI
jgi:20S proteasome alpha/beta subunit